MGIYQAVFSPVEIVLLTSPLWESLNFKNCQAELVEAGVVFRV